jgi:hypothetical protein
MSEDKVDDGDVGEEDEDDAPREELSASKVPQWQIEEQADLALGGEWPGEAEARSGKPKRAKRAMTCSRCGGHDHTAPTCQSRDISFMLHNLRVLPGQMEELVKNSKKRARPAPIPPDAPASPLPAGRNRGDAISDAISEELSLLDEAIREEHRDGLPASDVQVVSPRLTSELLAASDVPMLSSAELVVHSHARVVCCSHSVASTGVWRTVACRTCFKCYHARSACSIRNISARQASGQSSWECWNCHS